MPPRRVSQHLSRPRDEATQQPSIQTLPPIDEGHDIKAFVEIEEVKQ
jgi:hypothetical protein